MPRCFPLARFVALGFALAALPACERWETELPADTLWARSLGGALTVAAGDLFVLASGAHPGLGPYAPSFAGSGWPPVLVRLAAADGRIVFARQLPLAGDFGITVSAGPDLVVSGTGSTGKETQVLTVDPADGMVRWSTRILCTSMSSAFTGRPLSAADPAGAVVVAACDGGDDDVLQKWSPTENRVLWSRRWRQAGRGYATDLAVGADGDITLAARFYGTVDVGLGPLVTDGGEGHLIARFAAADGQPRWSVAVVGDMTGQPSIALGPGGQVAINGAFTGKLTAGGHTLGSSHDARGFEDVYVAGLSADGQFQWVQALRSGEFDYSGDVVILPDGKVVASLGFIDYIAVAGSAFRARSPVDLLLAGFDGATGRALRPRALLAPDALSLAGGTLAADASGRTFATDGSVIVALPSP